MAHEHPSASDPDAIDLAAASAELTPLGLAIMASTLMLGQADAATSLFASQAKVAELMRSSNLADATTLLENQDRAARVLLASQSAVAELLKARDVQGARNLLKVDNGAARDLMTAQSAVAELLRSHNLEVAAALLERHNHAADTLLAAQFAVAELLKSHEFDSASNMIEDQDESAETLRGAQSALAKLVRSHNVEMETATALNAELGLIINERTDNLTQANIRLSAATLAKSNFLASMSHELRTPLNAIIGFSGLLASGMVGNLEPEQKKQIDMISVAGHHLLRLVNEVLDLSAVEAGHTSINCGPVDIGASVSRIVDSVSPLVAERGLGLSFEVSPGAERMETDRARLEQVLFNLVGNAIKYTDSGSIRISVHRTDDSLVFAVADTGRGIAADNLARVFEGFYQVDDAGSTTEGAGLGLTVSKRLVELMGGTLSATSTPGVGSVFTFRLPMEAGPQIL